MKPIRKICSGNLTYAEYFYLICTVIFAQNYTHTFSDTHIPSHTLTHMYTRKHK